MIYMEIFQVTYFITNIEVKQSYSFYLNLLNEKFKCSGLSMDIHVGPPIRKISFFEKAKKRKHKRLLGGQYLISPHVLP